MKVAMKIEKEFDCEYLLAECQVRYWEDGELNGKEDQSGEMPCRNGELWSPVIELSTGKIINWDEGNTASIHYKVCDAGTYALLDGDMNEVKKIDGYVPSMLSPKDRGYGDYVIMDIDASGQIANWKVDVSPFQSDDE